MAKKKEVTRVIKLQVTGGQANPAPPIGTALGPTGIQIADFCQQFNEKTRDQMGVVLPTLLTIYDDRSFTFIIKKPPMSFLIKRELGLKSGSARPHTDKVGKLTNAQIAKIAEEKMPDLNAYNPEKAGNIVRGTARSMGIEYET